MADAARFDINIEAKAIGVDAAAVQLNAFAARIRGADVAATHFDSAVAASSRRLGEATAAAKLAAEALSGAEKRYGELESAATAAAKAVEKAAAAGKDTAALKASAESAAAAMRAQGAAVDDLRAKSKAASAVEMDLAATHKTLTSEQAKAQVANKKLNDEIASGKVQKGIEKQRLLASGALAVVGAYALVATAVVGAVFAMGRFAVASNPAAMMRLNMASARLDIGFKKLFRGLKLDGFISSIEKVMALFDEGNASAKGMKVLIETIFQPLFDGAAKAGPYVAEMFKGMIHGALRVVIAVLEIAIAIVRALSPEQRQAIQKFVDKLFTLENAFRAGTLAVEAAAVAFVVLGIAMFIAVLPIILMAAIVYGCIYALYALGKAIANSWESIKSGAAKIGSFLMSPLLALIPSLKTLGGDLIDGLIDGITGRNTKVKVAMTGVGDVAERALRARTETHSPSRMTARIGADNVAGFVRGIDDGEPIVTSALERMITLDDDTTGARGAGPASTSSSSSSSSRVIHIEHLTIGEGPVASKTWGEFKSMLLGAFDGATISIGAGEPATP